MRSAQCQAGFPSGSVGKAPRSPPPVQAPRTLLLLRLNLLQRLFYCLDQKRLIQTLQADAFELEWKRHWTVCQESEVLCFIFFISIWYLFKAPNLSQKYASNSDAGARTSWFKFWPHYLLVVWPGETHLSSLYLSNGEQYYLLQRVPCRLNEWMMNAVLEECLTHGKL